MFKFFQVFASTALVALLILGCSDDPAGPGDGDGNGNPQPTTGQISMTIAGQNWVSFAATADTTGNSNGIGFGGGRINPLDGFAVAFVDLANPIQETTYNFAPGAQTQTVSVAYTNIADSTQNAIFDPLQSSGTVTITDLNFTDGNISGSFSFDLYRQFGGQLVQIRGGLFNKIPLD